MGNFPLAAGVNWLQQQSGVPAIHGDMVREAQDLFRSSGQGLRQPGSGEALGLPAFGHVLVLVPHLQIDARSHLNRVEQVPTGLRLSLHWGSNSLTLFACWEDSIAAGKRPLCWVVITAPHSPQCLYHRPAPGRQGSAVSPISQVGNRGMGRSRCLHLVNGPDPQRDLGDKVTPQRHIGVPWEPR